MSSLHFVWKGVAVLLRNFLTLVTIFIATTVHADDKSAALIDYLRENAPRSFILDEGSVEFRDFPRGDGGRISAIGNFVLSEPFVEVEPRFTNLIAALQRQGYSLDEIWEALRQTRFWNVAWRTSNISELVVVSPAGSNFSFSAELPYLQTVSGIALSGRPNFDQVPGQNLSSVTGDYYIVGTDSFDARLNQIQIALVDVRARAELERQLEEQRRLEQEAERLRQNQIDALPASVVVPSCETGSAIVTGQVGWDLVPGWPLSYLEYEVEKFDDRREISFCISPNHEAFQYYVGREMWLTWAEKSNPDTVIVKNLPSSIQFPFCRDGWSSPLTLPARVNLRPGFGSDIVDRQFMGEGAIGWVSDRSPLENLSDIRFCLIRTRALLGGNDMELRWEF